MKKIIIITILVFLVMSFVLSYVIHNGVEELRESYKKPDTTITIHNGKPDTIIVKKNLPNWLK